MSTNLSPKEKIVIKHVYDWWIEKSKTSTWILIRYKPEKLNLTDESNNNISPNETMIILQSLGKYGYIETSNIQVCSMSIKVCSKLISYIEDGEDGENEEIETKKLQNTDNYVNLKRIEMIKKLGNKNGNPENRNTKFDTTKLVKLLEEINDNWKNQNYYSVGLLQRTVINFVPPIFECQNFEKVVEQFTQNRANPNRKTTIEISIETLQNPMRNIGNDFTHKAIQETEVLPVRQSVNFSQDFDHLLQEIIRKLQGNFLKIINNI